MKNIEYHYIIKEEEVIFEFPKSYSSPYWAFGDQIAVLNMHLYFNNLLNLNGKLSLFNINEEDELLLAKLFFKENLTQKPATFLINVPKEENIICNEFNENEYHNFFREIYKNIYFKITEQNIRNKIITYSCEAKSFVGKKTPPFFYEGIEKLKELHKDINFIEIGKKIRLQKTIEKIKESILHIGIDNGISHLCRCTYTPYLLVEHEWDVSRGFPEKYCDYIKCKSLNDMISINVN